MLKAGTGLVVWVSSSSTSGGVTPYLSPYFVAKAAMDSLAVPREPNTSPIPARRLTRREPQNTLKAPRRACPNWRGQGSRSFRVHVDPSQDGAEIVNGVADRVRAEILRRIDREDLLAPVVNS